MRAASGRFVHAAPQSMAFAPAAPYLSRVNAKEPDADPPKCFEDLSDGTGTSARPAWHRS
ncbi:hypothetical protein RHIZ404_200626 [Rhizobium sp. EC-SD404]|nr:hypothetical protein RHIZ404_200626 [Rhizobium sp. EC-SD404]